MNHQHKHSLQQLVSSQEMNELEKKTTRNIIIAITVVLLIIVIAAWQSLNYVEQAELRKAGVEASRNLDTIYSLQQNEQKFLKSILFQISSQSELQQFVIDRSDFTREMILDKWVRVEEQLSWIYQIRLIANSGYESLRVDYDRQKGFAERVEIKQNKKNQDYFKQTMELSQGELYVSPINLNREYNEVSYPLIPVIRFATPIFQPSGQSAGVLVVNFFADNFISIINNVSASSKGHTLMLDSDGNYLQGYDETQSWAHELISPDSENFRTNNPEVWQTISSQDSGDLLVGGQRYVFQALDYRGDGNNHNRYYVVQHITEDDIATAYTDQSLKLYLLFICVFVIASLMIFVYYRNRLGNEIEHNFLDLISTLFYSREAIVIADSNWNINLVNTAFSDVSGYSAESVMGKPCNEFYTLQDKEQEAAIMQSVADGEVWFGEVQCMTRDGSLKATLMFVNSVRDKSGRPTHYVLQMIDISERKAMENELKIAAAAFETRQAITITDNEGGIMKVNRAFTDITGYALEEVIGKNPRVLSSGRHGQDFYKNLWQSILDTGFWQGEIWNKHKNGKIYPEWIKISSIKDEKGEVIHYVATFEDITERKELEERLQQLSTDQ